MHVKISPEALKFIKSQEIAVLSTLTHDGQLQGSTIYYRFDEGKFYMLTKSDSAKAHNILAHPEVALTIFDPDTIKTVQLSGVAHIESHQATKQYVFEQLAQPRQYQGESLMPPVTHLEAGGFIAFRITPTTFYYSDYKNKTRIIPHGAQGPLI